MKQKKYAAVRIVIYSVITLILCAVLAWGTAFNTLSLGGISFGTSRFTYDDTGFLVAERTVSFPAGQVSSLDIEWVAGNIDILRVSGEEITVSESASSSLEEKEMLRYRLRNGRLEIKYCKPHISIGLFNSQPAKNLVVSLPEKTYDQLHIDAVSSDITITQLEAASLSLTTVSGNTLLKEVSLAGTLDYEGVSGNFHAESTRCSEFNADNVSGLVSLSGSVMHSADLETVSGDIRLVSEVCTREIDGDSVSANFFITLPADSAINWELESASGKIQSDFDHNGFGVPLSFETVSGNVRLSKP